MTSVLTRSRIAALALAGAATVAAVTVPVGAAQAATPLRVQCFYTVTAAGDGQSVRYGASTTTAAVGTMHTGDVVITWKTTTTLNGYVWSADFYAGHRYYPLTNTTTGAVYAVRDHCENIDA
ncbi:hypothetical protein Lfu02_35570 [Longispora fulva]|uniref:SH3 domain-containing protein n=1 Tax=Longispora fulva TaxID=619741 RepID=A0A8J7KKU2_9ACTN|nr:hypothetical protein [Longispora fulva]MBG6141660.1 hypothetical protein [Longispora fulva]GIG59185.1 hypothetical protein Lfu02_35570 [Longispora fulva]